MRIVHEDNHLPGRGKYQDVFVIDDQNGKVYVYACNGSYLQLSTGVEQVIDVCQLLEDSTCAATAVDNGDGTYTISGNGTAPITIDTNETLTVLGQPTLSAGNILTIPYTDEDGVTNNVTVDLSALAIDINTASFTYNPLTGDLVITETDGSTHTVDIGPFVETVTTLTNTQATGKVIGTYTSEDSTVVDIRETTTSLVNNGDGSFTFTNEDGVTTTIDITDEETLTSLAVGANGHSLDYTDEDGVVTNIDIKDLETLTTLTNTQATGNIIGTYTNEDGTVVNIRETPLTVVDSGLIDLSTSGTADHTLTATILPGSAGDVLTTVGGVPTWQAPVAGPLIEDSNGTPTILNGNNNNVTDESLRVVGGILGYQAPQPIISGGAAVSYTYGGAPSPGTSFSSPIGIVTIQNPHQRDIKAIIYTGARFALSTAGTRGVTRNFITLTDPNTGTLSTLSNKSISTWVGSPISGISLNAAIHTEILRPIEVVIAAGTTYTFRYQVQGLADSEWGAGSVGVVHNASVDVRAINWA